MASEMRSANAGRRSSTVITFPRRVQYQDHLSKPEPGGRNWGRCYDREALLRRPRRHLIALMLAVLILPACGVVLSAEFEGTEVFRDFELESIEEIDGEFPVNALIQTQVTVNQGYPVPIAISCRYENVDITDDQRKVAFNERTISVFEITLPANPGHEPGDVDEVEDQVFDFEFRVSEPGDYFIACFTVAAPENGIGRGFTIIEP